MSNVGVLAGAGLRGRRRSGVAATFVVLLLAAVGIAAGLVVARQGAPLLDDAASDADVAHLVLFGDAGTMEEVGRDPEVVAWSGPFASVGGIDLLAAGEEVPSRLTALDDPDVEVNRPPIQAGRWTAGANEIVLDRSVATDLGIDVGDTAPFRVEGRDVSFDVVGTAVDFTDCFYPQCEPARAWVTTAGLARVETGAESRFAQGWYRFDDPSQADPFVERLAAQQVQGIDGSESWLDTRADFLVLDRVFGSFVTAFGVFVLAVAAVVVAGSTAMRVVSRRREIGLLGAVGCTPREIALGLVAENLVVGAIAAVLGWLLAGFLAASLQLGIGRTLGPQDPSWSPVGLVVCLLTICGILLLATIVPALSAARRPVTDVLRDVPPNRVSWLSRRFGGLPGRLPLLGLQEAMSQPTRAGLSSLAIAVAVVGAVVSLGFLGAFSAIDDDPAMAGTPWDVAVAPGGGSVEAVEASLDASDQVESWYAEVPRRSTLDEGAFLSIATGGDLASADFRVVEGRSIAGAGEAIAGYGFLDRFGLSVGDEVEILVGTARIPLRIVGWYRVTEDSGEVLRYSLEDLAAVEGGTVPEIYRIRAAPGVDPSALALTLAAELGPQVEVEVLDTGVQDLAPLLAVLRLIAIVLLVMAGVNLLSTLLAANRESAGRIGVELAMGFTPRQVQGHGAVAGAGLGIAAAIVGVPLGFWLFRTLADVVSTSLGIGPGWMPLPSATAVLALAAVAIVTAAVLGALAASRVTARSVSDLVRGE